MKVNISNIIFATILLVLIPKATCQELIKINSNNGINKITYVLSSKDRYIDIVLSSSTIGVEEYRFSKNNTKLEFEESPPFLTFRCLSGSCIKSINHYKEESKTAFPILLTNDQKRNEQILKDVQNLIDGKLSPKIHHKRDFINLIPHASGTYGIQVEINRVVKKTFILDSGASLICINNVVFSQLVRAGTIREYDFLGKVRSSIADGSVVENNLINLRKVKIGKYEFTNIKCIVSANTKAPLLLGQNILKAFGTISIDYENNKLYILN
jgi:predicted aspartyl protease